MFLKKRQQTDRSPKTGGVGVAHSKGIVVPPLNDDAGLVHDGVRNYHEMCRLCHNAPGYSRSEVAQGLNPLPPDFTSKDVRKRRHAEVYWVIKSGIKMTGMASFGATHSEEEVLGLVSFLKRFRGLTPDEYTVMVKAAGLQAEKEHRH